MKRFESLAFAALLGLAVTSPVYAADSKADASPMASTSKVVKDTTYPFHGKVTALDLKNGTFTLGGNAPRIFVVGPDTKIMKDGKAATLKDAMVGDECGGRVTKTPDGKLAAISVRFGPKPGTPKAGTSQ